MLLAIDIGNTNIVLGLTPLRAPESKATSAKNNGFQHYWRIGTSAHRTEDEYAILIRALFASSGINTEQVKGAAICCVVPALQNAFANLCKTLFREEPLVIAPGIKTGMPI